MSYTPVVVIAEAVLSKEVECSGVGLVVGVWPGVLPLRRRRCAGGSPVGERLGPGTGPDAGSKLDAGAGVGAACCWCAL